MLNVILIFLNHLDFFWPIWKHWFRISFIITAWYEAYEYANFIWWDSSHVRKHSGQPWWVLC